MSGMAPDLYAERVAALREALSAWLADPGAALDLSGVRVLGAPLLAHPARDLRVWTWMTLVEAAAGQSVVAVLALAKAMKLDLPLLPRRPAAQHEAIAFFYERLPLVVRGADPALAEALAVLDGAIRDHLGEGFPREPRTPVATLASLEKPRTDRDGADPVRSLLAEAARLREASPSESRGYQLVRRALWLRLEEPREAAGFASFPAPSPVTRAAFTHADPQRVVEACEAALLAHPAWLDVHRWETQALTALGHAAPQDVILREARALLTVHPWLLRATFADGSPLADAATRAWLSPPPDDATQSPPGPRGAVFRAIASAKEHLAAGRSREALLGLRRALQVGRLQAAEYDPATFRDLYTLALDALSIDEGVDDPLRAALRAEWVAHRWELSESGEGHD